MAVRLFGLRRSPVSSLADAIRRRLGAAPPGLD